MVEQDFPVAKIKRIHCPRCERVLKLVDFKITTHKDQTYSVDPSVICTHDNGGQECGANFFVTRGQVEWVKR